MGRRQRAARRIGLMDWKWWEQKEGQKRLLNLSAGLFLGVGSTVFRGFLPPHHTRVPRATSRLAWQPRAASRSLHAVLEYSARQAPPQQPCPPPVFLPHPILGLQGFFIHAQTLPCPWCIPMLNPELPRFRLRQLPQTRGACVEKLRPRVSVMDGWLFRLGA